MNKLRVSIISSVALVGLLGGLIVHSPGCACTTPEMEFGWESGMATPPDYVLPEQLTPEVIEPALTAKYRDTPIARQKAPEARRLAPCVSSETMLACTYWTATGLLRRDGFEVEFRANHKGQVDTVVVRPVRQVFGHRYYRG